MKRLILATVFSLLFSLTAQSSSANELLIWDKLQGSAPKGYVLLMRHSYAPGVGVASGEGILIKADAQGEFKVFGATPKLNR